jgi:hypothetical protein
MPVRDDLATRFDKQAGQLVQENRFVLTLAVSAQTPLCDPNLQESVCIRRGRGRRWKVALWRLMSTVLAPTCPRAAATPRASSLANLILHT